MLNYEKINEIFEQSRYSKRDIAKGCGFTRPTLDGLLQGADVKVSTLVAWAKFFKKPVSYFFDESDKMLGNQTDHSGASVYGNVRINHTEQGCALGGGSHQESVSNEKERLLEEQIAILKSQLADKDEIISLYKQKLKE